MINRLRHSNIRPDLAGFYRTPLLKELQQRNAYRNRRYRRGNNYAKRQTEIMRVAGIVIVVGGRLGRGCLNWSIFHNRRFCHRLTGEVNYHPQPWS
jgi:hypothetical protein